MNSELSPMDRLYKPKTTPAKQVKSQDIKEFLRAGPAILALQDEIERLNMALDDQIEVAKLAVDMRDRTALCCAEMESRLSAEREWRNKQEDVTYRLNAAEAQIVRLNQDLKTEIQNRDHFRNLVAQQDACIKIAKEKVKEFLEAADREKKNAEHLARKTLELKAENDKLKEAATDSGSQAEMASQVPTLLEENRKYREQTTRLVEEKRVLEDKLRDFECQGCKTGEMGTYCGGCLGCTLRQAEHTIQQMDTKPQEVLESHGHNQKLIETLSKELNHTKQIARICRDGLTEVCEAGVFARKSVAEQALIARTTYIKLQNLPWENF